MKKTLLFTLTAISGSSFAQSHNFTRCNASLSLGLNQGKSQSVTLSVEGVPSNEYAGKSNVYGANSGISFGCDFSINNNWVWGLNIGVDKINNEGDHPYNNQIVDMTIENYLLNDGVDGNENLTANLTSSYKSDLMYSLNGRIGYVMNNHPVMIYGLLGWSNNSKNRYMLSDPRFSSSDEVPAGLFWKGKNNSDGGPILGFGVERKVGDRSSLFFEIKHQFNDSDTNVAELKIQGNGGVIFNNNILIGVKEEDNNFVNVGYRYRF